MNNETNAFSWFEIPVSNIARAKQFYQAIFNLDMEDINTADVEMAISPYIEGGGIAPGEFTKSDFLRPSMEGTVIYLNANPGMMCVLEKIEFAGGKILMPKTFISPEIGCMAFFEDTEGNRVGLHSQR